MKDASEDETGARAPAPPPWMEELASGLAVRAQFVLSGNLRDVFPVGGAEGPGFAPVEEAVWRVLARRDYGALLIHDPVDGLRLHEGCDPRFADLARDCGIGIGRVARTPEQLAALARRVVGEARLPAALMIDYASLAAHGAPDEVARLFASMDRLSRAPDPERPDTGWDYPPRNALLWLVNSPGDLPAWFTAGNPALQDLTVGMPDLSDRFAFARAEAADLPGSETLDAAGLDARLEPFAVSCEGMRLREMRNVIGLARSAGMGPGDLGEALRRYRIGTARNPWTTGVMRSRVKGAREVLEKRVKGQDGAVARTNDILVRSIMGLSGAQASRKGSRPRGILFFVGPTGVGKTELAKAVTEVLFGDESAMQRFDMSEFMGEKSMARLIGPAPGEPGHEEGGELVNAVRARPFSVFLFDEIEKGHPRILDAFLQILDDGRLSDSRGETGYFSESLIIFTSNVGMVGGDRSQNMGQNILPSDTHETLERKLTEAVGNHFRYELKRPELMNRIGQNIVAFEFITPRSAEVIFDGVVGRVISTVAEEHGVEVVLSDEARAELLSTCTFELGDGGRGIGNRIESNFINPLARLLFRREDARRLTITGLSQEGRETVLLCDDAASGAGDTAG